MPKGNGASVSPREKDFLEQETQRQLVLQLGKASKWYELHHLHLVPR